jgi:methanogenic corrinoid protein MtbC1
MEQRTSVSIGLSVVGDAGSTAALKAADNALYRAKRSGGDRVEVATARTTSTPVRRTHDAYVRELLQALSNADNVTAVEVLEDALELGKAPKELLLDVLIPGQREVGRLWMNGTWSVADEHAATAVAEQALTVVAPPRRSAPTARRIALACAEGEWHTMPARLAAELARTSALDVVMLGPSIPATHLQRYLRAASPTALALSATMPTNLIGASRSIQAARAEGIPVLVGGAAWGIGQHRAPPAGRRPARG